MITGPQIVAALRELHVTHAVWLPDSMLGTWEPALEAAPDIALVRVCREGEAWVLAAGLMLGGARPVVVIQCTGMFESGDALRNVIHDLKLPVMAVVGYRGYLIEGSTDSARRYAEPILRAWELDYVLIEAADSLSQMVDHLAACQAAGKAGVALVAEGRG